MWQTPSYGYAEPSFTVEGACTHTGSSQGGNVFNPTAVQGAPHSAFAILQSFSGQGAATLTVDLGNGVHGSPSVIWLHGYSYNGYNSRLTIAVSNDGSTWTSLGGVVTIGSSTNNVASWTNVASTTNIYRFIQVSVSYNYGGAGDLYLDSISVTW